MKIPFEDRECGNCKWKTNGYCTAQPPIFCNGKWLRPEVESEMPSCILWEYDGMVKCEEAAS